MEGRNIKVVRVSTGGAGKKAIFIGECSLVTCLVSGQGLNIYLLCCGIFTDIFCPSIFNIFPVMIIINQTFFYFKDGGIHAREWISPATVSGILRDILDNTNTTFSSLLNSLDIYLLPLLNPDGYEYSRTKDRLWRKVTTQTGLLSTQQTNILNISPSGNSPFILYSLKSSVYVYLTIAQLLEGKSWQRIFDKLFLAKLKPEQWLCLVSG